MAGLHRAGRAGSDTAYVTLVTNDGYVEGAAALLRSLALTGTQADRVVLHTAAVPEAGLERLAARGARLVRTDLLDTSAAFDAAHARDALHGAAPFTRGGKP